LRGMEEKKSLSHVPLQKKTQRGRVSEKEECWGVD